MTDLEKIEAWLETCQWVDGVYIKGHELQELMEALKAEKPQPDEGKMAWGVLKELADWRKIVSLEGGLAITKKYEWAEAIKKEINQVQAKYNEELTNKQEQNK